MKKNKSKKNIMFKVFSTSAVITMLCSSTLLSLPVLAENMAENQSQLNNETNEMDLSTRIYKQWGGYDVCVRADAPVVVYTNQTWEEKTQSILKQVYFVSRYKPNSAESARLNKGKEHVILKLPGYLSKNTITPGHYKTGVATFFKPSHGARSVLMIDIVLKESEPIKDFKLTLTEGNTKTIEYGTKLTPEQMFDGYVSSGDLVYDSVSSYEGPYTVGAKPGLYSGQMRFIPRPNVGANFNLTAPVTINVVAHKLDDATRAVNNLFTDKTLSELKSDVNQELISSVFEKVNALPDTPEKTKLVELMKLAQDLLNNSSETKKAEESVNNLFEDKEHTTFSRRSNSRNN